MHHCAERSVHMACEVSVQDMRKKIMAAGWVPRSNQLGAAHVVYERNEERATLVLPSVGGRHTRTYTKLHALTIFKGFGI